MLFLQLLLIISSIALVCGLLLSLANKYFVGGEDVLIKKINAVLPQSQCGQCSYPGCKPYAEAIANGDDINKCAFGGEETLQKLSHLLGVEVKNSSTSKKNQPMQALIDESSCIGCIKCIQVCPVDAIIGAPKKNHTVINDICTGCTLCIDPCPVSCITMVEVNKTIPSTTFIEVIASTIDAHNKPLS